MKIGLIASVLIHAAGLALAPSSTPVSKTASLAQTTAAAETPCRCDYELTVTDTRPPRALTMGVVPPHRFDP